MFSQVVICGGIKPVNNLIPTEDNPRFSDTSSTWFTSRHTERTKKQETFFTPNKKIT